MAGGVQALPFRGATVQRWRLGNCFLKARKGLLRIEAVLKGNIQGGRAVKRSSATADFDKRRGADVSANGVAVVLNILCRIATWNSLLLPPHCQVTAADQVTFQPD